MYGTTKNTAVLHKGDFLLRNDQSAAFQLSGLSFDTKFCFANAVELDFSSEWFKILNAKAHLKTPKLGVLHSVYAKAAFAAYTASH